MGNADVVVVGGGIGGASLASTLAREGLGVTVLEATVEYPDRVRGESMHAWGLLRGAQPGRRVRAARRRRPHRAAVEAVHRRDRRGR